MPIYEYCCQACGRDFEILVMGSDEKISCPHCDSVKVKRMLSCFSTSAEGPSAAGGCAPSGGFS
jgi:putative FmdB family regulatory protein